MKTKKLFLGLLMVAIASPAFGQVKPTPNEVSVELRTDEFTRVMDVPSLTAATDVTVGADGVIFVATINGNATPTGNSATIGSMPYAAKLDVKVHDDSNADTLVCTSVELRGFNQFGRDVDEFVYPNGENVIESKYVYERVTYIHGVGCTSNSADAGDVLRVSASAEIGLPYKIESVDAILAFTIWDLSATELFHFKPSQLTVDLAQSSVETDNLTPTLAAGDIVRVRVRAPKGK